MSITNVTIELTETFNTITECPSHISPELWDDMCRLKTQETINRDYQRAVCNALMRIPGHNAARLALINKLLND